MTAPLSVARQGVVVAIAIAVLLPLFTTPQRAAAFGPPLLTEQAAVLSRAVVGQREGWDQERPRGPRIRLVDVEDGDKRPRLALYAISRSFELLHTAKVDAEGQTEYNLAFLCKE